MLDLDLEQVDLDLLEFLILQPESRSRSAFQSVQHVGLQTERRQATENDVNANQTAVHFNTDQFRNETSIGDMIQCKHCQAMKFRDESKSMYCSYGKVNPEPFPPLPQKIAVLFEGTTDQSMRFLQDIQQCIQIVLSWL